MAERRCAGPAGGRGGGLENLLLIQCPCKLGQFIFPPEPLVSNNSLEKIKCNNICEHFGKV